MHINSTILLIGSGRLAQHLRHWNSLLEKPNRLLLWDRTQSLQILNDYLKSSNLIWLAISDMAILPFYENLLKNSNQNVVHFSGALNDKRLYCAHPLMSFPFTLLPDETYAKIFFVIEGIENLNEALPGFKNEFTALSPENKSYYHALCVLAGNFPQLVWNEVAGKMHQLNLPPEALDLYIKQIADNYIQLKERALTGPIIRKDHVTIEKNLASLNQSLNLKNIYSAITKEFTP